jgi:hypothetical protein
MKSVATVIMIIISVLSILGLLWLTEFSFTAKKYGQGVTVVKFDTNKLIFCKITVVLLWINIGLTILAQLVALA